MNISTNAKTKNNNKQYVIRGYQFGYNDECFYVEGDRIESVFTDKAHAEKQYKALEIKAARAFDLSEVEELFDGDDKARQACNQLTMDTCGVTILSDNGYIEWGTHIPKKMSDEDVLKLVNLAHMQSYQLLAFDVEQKFYALWLTKEESYYLAPSEVMEHFVYVENKADLHQVVDDVIDYNDWNKVTIKGTLADISHSPRLLERLIRIEKQLNYSEKTQTLTLSGRRSKLYIALNELLIKPLFEIRELSLEQVMEVEKKVKQDYMDMWA